MRNWAGLIPLLTAACSTVPAEGTEPSGGTCHAEGLEKYVGQAATTENGAAIQAESGARILRWIAHGSAVTLEFRDDRVNIKLDPQNRIEAVTCG